MAGGRFRGPIGGRARSWRGSSMAMAELRREGGGRWRPRRVTAEARVAGEGEDASEEGEGEGEGRH